MTGASQNQAYDIIEIARSAWIHVKQAGYNLVEALFNPFPAGWGRLLAWLVAGALFAFGILHWCYFLDWGKIPFDLHDWTIVGAYFDFLKRAVLSHQFPLIVTSPMIPMDRYLGRPDTIFSPQILLLGFLTLGQFALANILVLYAVGFLGLLLLRKHYHLSPLAFTILFLLFNLNGHITAHYVVGHVEWVAYFCLPYFVLLVLRLVEGEKAGWRWVLAMALVFLGIFLQGGFHKALWCLIFLFALGLFSPAYASPAIKAIFFGVMVSLVRILPPALQFFEKGVNFMSGFISLTDMLQGLVVLKTPGEALRYPFINIEWQETDHYIGLLGLAFVLIFGLYLTWRKGGRLRSLFAPCFVLAFLSVGYIYYPINRSPIPLAGSERVTARFLILPLIFLIVLGCIRFQEFLNQRKSPGIRERLLFLALLVLMGHDLLQHSRIWRYVNMYALFPKTAVDIHSLVNQHPDPPYVTSLVVGLILSLLALAFLSWKAAREKPDQPGPVLPS